MKMYALLSAPRKHLETDLRDSPEEQEDKDEIVAGWWVNGRPGIRQAMGRQGL